METKTDRLFIIIPAYNERENIRQVLDDWYPVIQAHSGNGESRLVVIDDGSKDDTYIIMQEYAKEHPLFSPITKTNSGHGATVLYGYHYALDHGADFVFQTDSDGQTLPSEFEQFWDQREAWDMVIGWRNNRQDGGSRIFVTRILRLVIRICFGVSVKDANTPFRLMKADTLRRSDFKLNNDGLIPVVVQDYKNDQVLMVAYMNEEAFQNTLKTGKMTYWSRSRQELWLKGLTSGHFQYVKSLALDCDNDTILAKVDQIGAACHTGSRSCFFKPLVQKEYNDTNPLHVFQDVYDVIADRKVHPKDGSYTNYLFDKGIDKILRKVGEECAEIIIAAKNPDKEEIKYEISDFLYHAMVLMVEKGVTWEEITSELARR